MVSSFPHVSTCFHHRFFELGATICDLCHLTKYPAVESAILLCGPCSPCPVPGASEILESAAQLRISHKEIPGPHLLSVSILNDRSQENVLAKQNSPSIQTWWTIIYIIYMTRLPFWNTLAIPRLLSPTLPALFRSPNVTSSGVNGGLDGCKWGLCGCSFGRPTSGAWRGELMRILQMWNDVQ